MIELMEANWPVLLAALLLGLGVAWFAFTATRRTRVDTDRRDVLDEGAAPTQRNQALIDAPPVAAAPPTRAPTPAATRAVASASTADDLTRIKGLGPKLAEQLGALGVTSYAQIAGWDDAAIDRIDAQLGRFQGRIRRDDWVTQARLLAEADRAAYEERYGRL
ncbi:MAG: hypothetical protein DI636_01420 [Pelagerythrobacter marensis]|nr:MAG: hypothetical protein DI636_01420 [Pelagerythrobacter marensis]